MQRKYVRVVELRGDLDLAQESFGTHRGGELGPHDLDRYISRMLDVARQVNRGHAARTEFMLDHVTICQGIPDAANVVVGSHRNIKMPRTVLRSNVASRRAPFVRRGDGSNLISRFAVVSLNQARPVTSSSMGELARCSTRFCKT